MYAKRTSDGNVQVFLTPDDARQLVRMMCNCPRQKEEYAAEGRDVPAPLTLHAEDDQGKFTVDFGFDWEGYELDRQQLKDHWRQISDLLEAVLAELRLKPTSSKQFADWMGEAEEYLDNNEFELALDALEDMVGDKEDKRLEQVRGLLEAMEEEEGETEEAVQALWQAVEFELDEEE
jgi:hypothetical protein